MADAPVVEKGTLFTPELVTDLFNTVKGKSSIAALCGQSPMPFNGNEIMVFSMDDEIALVGESEKKERGSMAIAPVTVVPVKVEYGARVTDEFLYATDEKKLDILSAFSEGYAAKIARGLDIMALHGMNPRTKTVSSLITNSFTTVTNQVDYDASAPDDSLNSAIMSLEDYDCTGIALSKTFANAMGQIKVSNDSNMFLYPQFAFGAQGTDFYGTACSVNTTVNFDGSLQGLVGDFSAFRWGYAKDIPLEVIEYGDPDNSGMDLKGYNQVYLRSEAYIGFGVIDPAAFCKITGSEASPTSVKATSAKK